MCGITGFVDFNKNSGENVIYSMTETLLHRGPDDLGIEYKMFENYFIGLGHARLSIIDLTPGGHQPMSFKYLTIVFNGEIYNYKEIRTELNQLGHKFLTTSDTEVVLHSFYEWGIKCVEKFIGMFAISIFDKKEEKLYLIRDRTGVKPLYYYYKQGLFLFASELKSFHRHSYFTKEIDKNTLISYFNYGYIPAPLSVFKHTKKLMAGSYLTFDLKSRKISVNKYWDASFFYKLPKIDISFNEAKKKLTDIFVSSFNYRMISDVPVGVFLSGGYDSSIVTAFLQKDRTEKLKTFTIGFEEGNNEAPFAKKIAEFLGTNHYEYTCTTKEAQDIISELVYFYDEPFADSSAIPTILVSRFAKEQVTVALSADGGDEVFAGYNSYFALNNYLKKINKIPNFFYPFVNVLLDNFPTKNITLKHKLSGLKKTLKADRNLQPAELYRWMRKLPEFYRDNLFSTKLFEVPTFYDEYEKNVTNPFEAVLLADYIQYLPDDIMTKVDRATMSVSLEGREPLLDHRIFEFVAQLPLEYKLYKGTGKYLLKSILHEIIPKELMDRPKTGFSIPLSSWLQGDLSHLLEEYLSSDSLKITGLFNKGFVQNILKRFKEQKLHHVPLIWRLLIFQMWYKKWYI